MLYWTPAKTEEGLRYSIIMNLINQKLSIYEKYLTDVITPKIPVGATVISMVILLLVKTQSKYL
jgi:hypothetical protein